MENKYKRLYNKSSILKIQFNNSIKMKRRFVFD